MYTVAVFTSALIPKYGKEITDLIKKTNCCIGTVITKSYNFSFITDCSIVDYMVLKKQAEAHPSNETRYTTVVILIADSIVYQIPCSFENVLELAGSWVA